ncbi:MAG: S46 family peptidase [Bacteroidales bacterium]|nr:S46 family peptidase [Bacteroidales bacterium]
MIRFFTSIFLGLAIVGQVEAREGMWIPMLLEKFNMTEMQDKGFELTAEDIYSINQASMKDAVVIFGGGCTGGLISSEGLLITNHHCGYSVIQKHSSVSNDYLTDGFWAMSREEELVNPDLKATFLRRMEDVTDRVLKGVEDSMSMEERKKIIKVNMDSIKNEAISGTHYQASVEPFYYGNQYFLFVNEVFLDVRLVGAAPSSIGKFGGDTDNWMWPRHTGDFALFRIYADAANRPSTYALDNTPYKPLHYFPISMQGVEVSRKQASEAAFRNWVDEQAVRQEKYGSILDEYALLYKDYSEYRLGRDYLLEFIGRSGLESVRLAGSFYRLSVLMEDAEKKEALITHEKEKLKLEVEKHFKDYYLPIDRDITQILMGLLGQDLPQRFQPAFFETIEQAFNGDENAFVDHFFATSVFTNPESVHDFIDTLSPKTVKILKKDPAFRVYNDLRDLFYNKVNKGYEQLSARIDSLNRIYMVALMDFETDKVLYPDANFTLRVSYGQVKGYQARDAVVFDYYTTLDGIIEKDNPDIYDYNVPDRLKALHNTKDYGSYEKNGTVPVCFIATNHTTGGNSGSPVVNKRGELIGINFDRAWEGVMSDLMFNPDQCRNISVDMRYVLFLVDKFANAGYLLDEMTIVK